MEQETVAVYTFIGRMVQHVFPKGFQRIRSYGVQATKTFATLKSLIQEALAKVKGGENMCRRRHEPLLQEGRDIPFGPPPEEYLYRCPVCSEAMLVNEAIIDMAIGAAKFRREYPGGMPIIGCPGCNGKTMAYVGED